MAARFAKAPAATFIFICETQRDSAKGGGDLRPRLFPWKDHRLVVSRSAALSPCSCGSFEVSNPLLTGKQKIAMVAKLRF